MYHYDDDDEMWCHDVPCFDDDDDGGGGGDLDQWEYLLQTFATLPEVEAAPPLQQAELSSALPMSLNGAAAAAAAVHGGVMTLQKIYSSPQTVIDSIDNTDRDFLYGYHSQDAVFGAVQEVSNDVFKNTAYLPLGLSPDHKHVLTSELIQLSKVAESSQQQQQSTTTFGTHSMYTKPTLDSASTTTTPQGHSLWPEALHYVITPHMAEILQSNGWSTTTTNSLFEHHRNGGCTDDSMLESSGHQSTKSTLLQCSPTKSAHKRPQKRPSKSSRPATATTAAVCLPLTAYNYFYRHERDTIVQGMTHPSDPLPPSVWDFTPAKKAELLHQHWYVNETRLARYRLFSSQPPTLIHYLPLSCTIGMWIHSRKSANIERRTESLNLQRTCTGCHPVPRWT
jgi:hypothetical protein